MNQPDTGELSFPCPVPPTGETFKVADGITGLRLPLPGRLDHVHAWLLDTSSGFAVIDCGMDDEPTRKVWQTQHETRFARRPITEILVTHAHIDHIGHLGSLARRTGLVPRMSASGYLAGSIRSAQPAERMAAQLHLSLVASGAPESLINRLLSDRKANRALLSPVPLQYRRVADGDIIAFGSREWRVMTFGGHAPEMISLYCERDKILIAADQVLYPISPSITVPPEDPAADPLGEYFQSLEALSLLPEDTLVLPSHGRPFYGLYARLRQLRDHHRQRLDTMASLAHEWVSVYDVACDVFPRPMAGNHARQAMAEALAHLNRLVQESGLSLRAEPGKPHLFRRSR